MRASAAGQVPAAGEVLATGEVPAAAEGIAAGDEVAAGLVLAADLVLATDLACESAAPRRTAASSCVMTVGSYGSVTCLSIRGTIGPATVAVEKTAAATGFSSRIGPARRVLTAA